MTMRREKIVAVFTYTTEEERQWLLSVSDPDESDKDGDAKREDRALGGTKLMTIPRKSITIDIDREDDFEIPQ